MYSTVFTSQVSVYYYWSPVPHATWHCRQRAVHPYDSLVLGGSLYCSPVARFSTAEGKGLQILFGPVVTPHSAALDQILSMVLRLCRGGPGNMKCEAQGPMMISNFWRIWKSHTRPTFRLYSALDRIW